MGLTVAAVQASHLLRNFVDSTHQAPKTARHVLMETTGIYACLNQLDAFLTGKQESSRSRRSLIMIEQVIIIFTDCVSIFSELEQALETLKADAPMRVIDKVKWSLKEKTLAKLLDRLRGSKMSLNLMLTILTCNSIERAEESTRGLATGLELLLRSNLNMTRRLHNIERMHPALAASSSASRASSIFTFGSILGDSRDNEISFEKALETSPAYKRAGYRQIRKSTKSSSMVSPGPSLLSRLSLGDVENVSAIALPIASRELWNHHRYSAAQNKDVETNRQTLDAWYYPPPNVGLSSNNPERSLVAANIPVLEMCIHQDSLFQRAVYKSVYTAEVSRPSDISPFQRRNPTHLASIYRRSCNLTQYPGGRRVSRLR